MICDDLQAWTLIYQNCTCESVSKIKMWMHTLRENSEHTSWMHNEIISEKRMEENLMNITMK